MEPVLKIKLRVRKIPEKTTIYLNHSTPFHNKNMPPKVKIIEIKGSTIKKYLSFLLMEVVDNITESKKNITDMERI